jgi:hypothetical protein
MTLKLFSATCGQCIRWISLDLIKSVRTFLKYVFCTLNHRRPAKYRLVSCHRYYSNEMPMLSMNYSPRKSADSSPKQTARLMLCGCCFGVFLPRGISMSLASRPPPRKEPWQWVRMSSKRIRLEASHTDYLGTKQTAKDSATRYKCLCNNQFSLI